MGKTLHQFIIWKDSDILSGVGTKGAKVYWEGWTKTTLYNNE